MIQLEVTVFADRLRAQLEGAKAVLDTERILDTAAAILLNRIRTRFLREVDPDEQPWIPSKAGLRRRALGGTGTLFDTGRLFRSIQLAGTDGTRVIKTDVPYAADHQYGTRTRSVTSKSGPSRIPGLPARRFLGINNQDIEIFERRLINRISQAVSAGRRDYDTNLLLPYLALYEGGER